MASPSAREPAAPSANGQLQPATFVLELAPEQLELEQLKKSVAAAAAPTSSAEGRDGKQTEDPLKQIGFFAMFRYADGRDWFAMVCGLIGALGYGVAMPSLALILGDIVGDFVTFEIARLQVRSNTISEEEYSVAVDNFSDVVRNNCILFLSIGIATMIACYVMQMSWMISGERQAKRVRQKFINAVMNQDVNWFDVHQTGELTTKLTSDTLLFQEGISEKVSLSFSYAVQFFTGFVIAFIRSWRLTLVLIAVLPAFGVSGAIVGKAFAAGASRSQEAYGKAGAVAQEVLSNIRTVVAFGGQKRASSKFTLLLDDAVKANVRRSWITGAGFGVFFGLLYGSDVCFGLLVCAKLKNDGLIGQGTVLAVLFAITIGAFSIINLSPSIQAINKGRASAAALFEVVESVPEIDSVSEKGLKPEAFSGDIAFESVNFAYPSRPDQMVLKQFSLSVPQGKTVALVGLSGSGKSTIIQLLERYYNIQGGDIKIDGHSLRDLNLRYFRQNVGLVSQEPVLFDATIEQNISYGAPDNVVVTQEMIEHACKMSNAHDFISRLPQGYQTMVGEKGALLSGGQKQRIAIARALIKDPKILLLDEATSAIDTESERLVQAALDNAAANRTTIVIAHRLSTIKAADIIVVMAAGEIVEVGNHNSLLERGGMYHDLVQGQQLKTQNINDEDVDNAAVKASELDIVVDTAETTPGQTPKTKLLERAASSAGKDKSIVNAELDALAKEEAEKLEEKRILKEKSVSIFRVLRMQNADMGWLAVGVISAAINGAILPVFGILMGKVLVIYKDDGDELMDEAARYALLFMGMMFINLIVNFLQTGALGITGERLTRRVRSTLFDAMLRQEIAWFDDKMNGTGVLTSRLSEQADRIQGLTGPNAANIIQLVVSMGVSISLAFYYGWKMTLIILCAVPVLAVGAVFESRVMTGSAAPTRLQYARAAQTACDAIQNIRTVKSLTREGDFISQYMSSIDGPYKAGIRKAVLGAWGFGFSQATQFWVYGLAFYVGYRFILADGMTSEEVFNVLFVILFGSIAFSQAATFGPNVAKAKIAAISYFELIDRQPVIDVTDPAGLKPVDVAGSADCREVEFAYPARQDAQILKGLNLEMHAGKVIALVGASGCGKSTVMGLLQRFYDVNAGVTSVEGYNVKQWNLPYLREQLAVVSQEPSLFIGTIAENIAYSKPEATLEEIQNAATIANIHTFITNLPEQYRTSVTSSQLSGGQKQRIAIARALLRQPKILLLDEATSALDVESERAVQAALEKASKGRTTIAIAHRLSTIQDADIIFVFRNGRVVEEGRHFELLDKKGVYAKLVERQQLGTN
ncbi:ATP-binding cassette, sub-B (MDR TAP), member 4 [Geranomyces variabilis]|uniref:ATP-binding cassette, sub-B (MDR TAP), member 4 n=1 Tax=Geranomyces variabilis TaxID=109894 RepID=A0AAD5TCQ6_9FUNG|nr:ATP-binding cassette, sub-B (MDR TAP), member 4 [Geranomyces variabilis]